MELRAHHLLCIPMYQGYGYSEDFCVHMAEVIKKIKTTDEPIRPLASPDVVCECCPNLQKGHAKENILNHICEQEKDCVPNHPCEPEDDCLPNNADSQMEVYLPDCACEHEARTSQKDKNLLECFGLTCGQTYNRDELKKIVLAHMTEETFLVSCGKCEWREQGLCNYKLWRKNFEECF